MKTKTTPITCPKCGHKEKEFHKVCPECGRPFVRDFIDTQVHPRDPDPTGICSGKFWARVFLALVLLGLVVSVLSSFGLLRI
jgi:predicted amidophosphoribosyltransferase